MMNVTIRGSTVKRIFLKVLRAIRVNDEGYVENVPINEYAPQAGSHQTLDIDATADTLTAALTVGAEYEFTADADCYWKFGANGSIAATTSDPLFPGGSTRFAVIQSGLDYVSVIRRSTTVLGGFHIQRVSA